MSIWLVLIAGFFLPLFPLSMAFSALLERVRHPALRAALLIAWPQLGVFLLAELGGQVPEWVIPWALMTAALYAFRALALREVGQWSGFLAVSAWALLWIPLHAETEALHLYALGLSLPVALLAPLTARLERQFGAAYTGLYGGLAEAMPRFTGVFVFVVLAIVATPLFPPFFVMLAVLLESMPEMPLIALGVAIVWLFWTWAGTRVLQGLIVGPGDELEAMDLSTGAVWGYSLLLALLAAAGIYTIGGTL